MTTIQTKVELFMDAAEIYGVDFGVVRAQVGVVLAKTLEEQSVDTINECVDAVLRCGSTDGYISKSDACKACTNIGIV